MATMLVPTTLCCSHTRSIFSYENKFKGKLKKNQKNFENKIH
jgi:hypothetical protein